MLPCVDDIATASIIRLHIDDCRLPSASRDTYLCCCSCVVRMLTMHGLPWMPDSSVWLHQLH
jgi:hypothetical protein